MGTKRLQGNSFKKELPNLTLVKYQENKKGHILGTYVNDKGETIIHWLNDKEIKNIKEEKIVIEKLEEK
jgi:hypothetical protein